MQIGLQITDITPPLGVEMAGHFVRRHASEVHDPLTAHAMVLSDDNTTIALVGTDLVGMPDQVARSARERIANFTGIPPENMMIWGTHTHAGPVVSGLGLFREGDDDYTALLPKLLAGAVASASESTEETSTRIGVGKETHISFNRRYRMADGSVQTNPGVGNPAVQASDGPIDPDVGVLYLQRRGSVCGALVNFANHLDVLGSGNTWYSADFPYYMRQTLADAYGDGFFGLFGNGACGNINHINVFGRRRQGGYDHARRMGRILAGDVLKTEFESTEVDLCPLWAESVMVELPLREFSDEQIAEFRRVLEETEDLEGQISSGNFERGRAKRSLALVESGITSEDVEVQVLGMGPLVIVGIPGEYFVEFGLQIKKRSPADFTFLIELANGYKGYIPTEAAFRAGAYEGSSARYAPEAGQMLADSAINIVESRAI